MLQQSAQHRVPTCAPSWSRCGSTTCTAGKFDLAIGAIVSTLLDPSDYFNAWYSKDGPQNYSHWDNAKFDALLPQIDREVDPEKRIDLIRQAEAIMEQDPAAAAGRRGRRSTTAGTTT